MTYRRALLGTSLLWLAAPALAGPQAPAYTPDLLPPNPSVGECYARVEIPAQYEATTQTVLTREAYKRRHVQQPQFKTRSEAVMVKEPSVRYVVRQPTYATVTQKVMTRPGFDKLSVSEPSFRTVTETLQTGKPRLVWKRGNPAKLRAQGYIIHSTADAGLAGRGYSSTTQYGQTGGSKCGPMCEIWCLVEEPGDSVTVNRQVMTHAGQIHRTPVPPQYETITKQIVKDPGGVEKIPVPAEYRNIHVQELVHPGGEAYVEVPAEYGQVQGRRLVSEARYEWRRVVCKPGMAQGHVQGHVTSHMTGHTTGHTVHHAAPTTVHSTTKTRTLQHNLGHQTSHQHSHGPTTQSQIRVTRPAYPSGYTSRYEGTYSTSGQTTHYGSGTTTNRFSQSGHPHRAYSGPAYADPSVVHQDQSVIYENRAPIRVRR